MWKKSDDKNYFEEKNHENYAAIKKNCDEEKQLLHFYVTKNNYDEEKNCEEQNVVMTKKLFKKIWWQKPSNEKNNKGIKFVRKQNSENYFVIKKNSKDNVFVIQIKLYKKKFAMKK